MERRTWTNDEVVTLRRFTSELPDEDTRLQVLAPEDGDDPAMAVVWSWNPDTPAYVFGLLPSGDLEVFKHGRPYRKPRSLAKFVEEELQCRSINEGASGTTTSSCRESGTPGQHAVA